MEVECVLYPRKKIEHVGIATTNAMYFFGANDRLGVDDVRLAAHDAAGLQIWNGGGEWIWRPVQNPGTLQISAFLDNSPRAFGLLQRNRDVAAFEDDTHHYERMPSVWVEPLDAWGEGSVQLVEIPTDSDINDNIVAYWRPKAALEAGGAFGFRYRLSWCWRPSQVPPLAIVAATRVGNGGSRRREFAIDFVGEIFRDRARSEAVKSAVSAAPGKIVEVTRFVMPERGMMRLLIVLDTDAQPFSELRAQLLEGETPASETWLYRWIA
jgi:glucans biosynthesis protein